MTIERTAPIHELDRLLDALALDPEAPPASEWGPMLGRLAALDDAFAPSGDTLRDVRRQLLSDAARPAGRDEVTGERVAPTAAAGRRFWPVATPSRRGGRRAGHAVAAAAVLLVAVGSVWFDRGGDHTPIPPAPSVAQLGAAQAAGTSTAPGPNRLVSLGRPGVDAVDVARASIGGFGSADLVGLLAIGADAGRRDLVAAREQMLQEVDASSWTDLVEGRGWAALVASDRPEVPTSDQPAPIGAG